MDDADKLLVEAEVTDNRALYLKLRERKNVGVNPFIFVGIVFFSALITVVVFLFILIFILLKATFSSAKGLI